MSIQVKKKLLSMAVCGAVAGGVSGAAIAQEAEAAPGTQEEVVVYGIKTSLQNAQDLKREANTVKDVVTASDIGALPDKSVTEALMRVPGVTVERFASSDDPNHFAAEGTGVVVRGLKRVRSEINGRDSFSARRDGSGLNFEDFPPELLGSVEVVKNQTADLITGGAAGTVNLVTRKPFDSDDMLLSGSLKGSYGDFREEFTPVFSGLFSDRWDIGYGELGFLISYSQSEYKDRGDGVALDNYYERSATAAEMPQFGLNGTALAAHPNDTLYVPAGVAIRTADSLRERIGMASSLQWQNPNETLEVTLEYIGSEASLTWGERTVQYGEQGFNVNPNNNDVSADTVFDSDGFMTSGTLLMSSYSLAQSRWRSTETVVDDVSLHIKYHPTEALTVDFDVQQIDSTFKATDYTLNNRFANDDVFFSLGGDVPRVNFVGENLTNPQTQQEMYINSAMDKEDDHEADATSFAADLEYEIEDSWVTSVQTGLYMSEKKQTIRDSVWNWGEVSNSWQAPADGGFSSNVIDHPELYEQVTFGSGDFHGGGVLGQDTSLLFPKLENARNWQSYHDSTGDFSAFVPLRNRGCFNGCELQGAFLPSEISSATEERSEFYVQVNFANEDLEMPIKGNFGLRHVSWQVESTGATQFPAPRASWQSDFPFFTQAQLDFQNGGETEAVTVQGDEYSKVLPSFNLSLSVSDDQIMRFAYSKNIFLPEFQDFRYFRQITMSRQRVWELDDNGIPQLVGIANVNFDGVTGNPQIEPEEVSSIDVTYEWYFSDVGSLTMSLFKKDLDNIIRKRLFVESVANNGTEFPVNFRNDTNEGSGTLQGFEIAYQQFYDFLPGAWSGLGAQINYTFVGQQDVDDKVGFGDGIAGAGGRNNFRAFNNLDLPGYSDETINVALMYEKYGIQARLAYNWRSDYLLTRRDADLFAPVIADDTTQVDASISYDINDNLKVGLEISNLTDEVITTKMMYNQEGDLTPRSHFKTDRRYGLFIRANL